MLTRDYAVSSTVRWSFMFLTVGFLFAGVAATVAWCVRSRRDVREPGLRIEEGELVSKWIRTSQDDDGVKTVRLRVRVGARTHDIRSPDLFAALGCGVRYRLFLSRFSGQLIALESMDAFGGALGYRHAGGARALMPGSRAPRIAEVETLKRWGNA
jgi:hypothetical protein